MPVDTTQIPPQALQALQQSGVQGGDITQILAQLAEMSPDEVSQALAQLGVNIDPQTLQQAAEQWVDQAADSASGSSTDDTETPTEDAGEADRTRGIDPADQEEMDEGEPAPASPGEEEAEGEDASIPAGARPTGYQGGGAVPRATAAMPAAGGAAMPRSQVTGPPIPSGGAVGTMDDLVSAAMMQRATGNPNAAVPSVGGTGNVGMPRAASAIPNPRPSGAPNNPRMAAMIADLYRSTGGKTGKRRTPSAAPSKR